MSQLSTLLGLKRKPVAITFADSIPAGVPPVATREAAGCGYWRRAAEGETFYTEANDHKGCPVGAHTHNVPLDPAEQKELMGLVQIMVGLSYIKMEEVPKFATRKTPLKVAVYAPLDQQAGRVPDVVLVCGDAKQLMLLSEAAQALGIAGAGPTLGRPTCTVLPEAINTGQTASSFGCVGNRVYTGASDSEAYLAIPGASLAAVEEKLGVILQANAELEKFHQARAAAARV